MSSRVLCVDDDPATQMVLNGIIEDAGWRSESALNAVHALEDVGFTNMKVSLKASDVHHAIDMLVARWTGEAEARGQGRLSSYRCLESAVIVVPGNVTRVESLNRLLDERKQQFGIENSRAKFVRYEFGERYREHLIG